ncbi:hypothetical protein RhiirA4_472019 [Rhizophagus irregularis]|uniref:Uncharacterized protein n=1 Tax=Rhizophagus irregularis TaxID=588596 RepID=A0A2I1H495_9GLOM|nr:hypothetical protein RhiirA4_472019 [Rhizophagus irregularis]
MARFTCAHIKKDNTICGNKCCDPTGCYRHWKLYEKNIEKKPCLVSGCRKYTVSITGCCPDHSSRFHSLNYRMRQKYGAEALQPKIPEAPIFELSDVVKPLRPRIYENPVSESDDEDIGLDLFGD